MNAYVRFRCGAVTLYLDTRAVKAVSEVPDNARGGIVEWQGQAVEKLDINAMLGQPGHGDQALVVTTKEDLEGDLVMLTVDSVDNVLPLAPADFRPLPPVAGGLGELFDAAIELGEGLGLGFRLRYPLPQEILARGA